MTLEDELREREERHLRAEVCSSRGSMEDLLAEEFVESGSPGRTFDRATVIDAAGMPRDGSEVTAWPFG